jgi:hypothetical protein
MKRVLSADRAGLSTVLGSVAANGPQVVIELHTLGIPTDARFGELYGLNDANDADMDAPEGWDQVGYPNIPSTTRAPQAATRNTASAA